MCSALTLTVTEAPPRISTRTTRNTSTLPYWKLVIKKLRLIFLFYSIVYLFIYLIVYVYVVEVKSGADGFMVKMRDGRQLRCVHNNPQGGHLPDYAPHPAIVLKMEDGTGLLLPIIVCT